MMQRKRSDAAVTLIDMGMRLKARRLALGMSQQQFADDVGVSFQQVQKYENGTNRISADMLQLLALALDISPLYFLASDEDLKQEAVALAASEPGIKRLVCAYNNVKSPQAKAHLLALLEAMQPCHSEKT